MNFSELKLKLGTKSVFRATALGLTPTQCSRWCARGLLVRLKRGVYRLSSTPRYDPLELAALLVPGSYITGRSALEYHGYNRQEYTGPVTSATPGKPRTLEVEGRVYHYTSLTTDKVSEVVPAEGGEFYVATPLTAIMDLYHRKTVSLSLDSHLPDDICYEKFDAEDLRNRCLATRIARRRRVIGRVLLKCRYHTRRQRWRNERERRRRKTV